MQSAARADRQMNKYRREFPMIKQKRVLAGALGCLLLCSHPAGYLISGTQPVQAAGQSVKLENTGKQENLAAENETAGQDNGQAVLPQDLEADYNDPDYVKMQFQKEDEGRQAAEPFAINSVEARTTKSPYTGLVYTHAPQLSDCVIIDGIDVSKWQADINWKKVKAAGVKFVFIRCGYTALSKQFAMYEDEYFRKNIQGAYDQGIQIGVYFFSNSITTSEAKQEARKTLELIEDYEDMITLPVVYDFEAFSSAYRAYGLSKAQVTKNMKAYSDIIQDAGYTPMYYGSPSFLNSSFDVPSLSEYDCWLANYTTKTTYTGDYTYWQYSSSGQVDGIEGNTDCNFYYSFDGVSEPDTAPDDIVEGLGPVTGLAMEDHDTDFITITWDQLEEASGYKVYRSKSYGGTYKQMKVINGNEVTEFTDASVVESEGRQYFYKVVPFVLDEDNNLSYGVESDILTAYTKRLHSFRLKTNTNLNLREHAGTEYASAGVVPAGTGLPFYKFTLSNDEKKWYKVTYTKNGKSYTGYLSGSYVTVYTYGKTTKKVNMRSGAGLSYKIQRAVPQGTKITVVANKTDASGIKWSQIKYTLNGKGYTGYIPKKYIQQI